MSWKEHFSSTNWLVFSLIVTYKLLILCNRSSQNLLRLASINLNLSMYRVLQVVQSDPLLTCYPSFKILIRSGALDLFSVLKVFNHVRPWEKYSNSLALTPRYLLWRLYVDFTECSCQLAVSWTSIHLTDHVYHTSTYMATGRDQLRFSGKGRCLATADACAEDIYFIFYNIYVC